MFDEALIYRGSDIPINSKIIVKQPTLDQIVKFGEKEYFSAVHTLVSVGADMKWQLYERGIDSTKINDYDLFITLTRNLVGSHRKVILQAQESSDSLELLNQFSQEEISKMLINPLGLILNIDIGDFEVCKVEKTDEIILYNEESDITIDRAIYFSIVDIVRRIHGFKRNNEMPANEFTKQCLIDDARDEMLAAKNRPYKSILRPLVSYMKILNRQCGTDVIWNMKINEFFYDLKKSTNMQETKLLLQGAYSGFASLKNVDTEKLNMLTDVNNF